MYGTSQARIGEEDDDEEEAEDHIGPELHVIKRTEAAKDTSSAKFIREGVRRRIYFF